MSLRDASNDVSAMEKQLQDTLNMHLEPGVKAYAKQLRNYLTKLISEAEQLRDLLDKLIEDKPRG